MSSTDFQEIYQEGLNFINGIMEKKYFHKNENSWDDVVSRISKILFEGMSKNNPKLTELELKIRHSRIIEMIQKMRHIPAGSILYGMGSTERKSSLSNCYFIPIKEDSLEGIFECAKEMARTFSYRGGVGLDVSILRPRKSTVKNAAKYSTGAISFVTLYSFITNLIGQDSRRGACLVLLDIRHPDIMSFIWSKSKPEEVFGKDSLTGEVPNIFGANISVKLNKEFMDAVKADKDWTFIFPDHTCKQYIEWDGDFDKWILKKYPIIEYQTLKARDILRQISESAWTSGDPGVMYWDNVVNYSCGSFDPRLIPVGVNP